MTFDLCVLLKDQPDWWDSGILFSLPAVFARREGGGERRQPGAEVFLQEQTHHGCEM